MAPCEVNTRSGWGDNHAATEDAMRVSHAQVMLEAGLIDEKMATELSKPHRGRKEIEMNYTPEYLATFPGYTGENHDFIPPLEEALQRQREKDKAQEKLLADYFAGKVDENGNPIKKTTATAKTARPKQATAKGHDSKKRKAPPVTADDHSDTVLAVTEDITTTHDDNSPEQPTAKRQRTTKQAKSTVTTTNTHSHSSTTEQNSNTTATEHINHTTESSNLFAPTASSSPEPTPRKHTHFSKPRKDTLLKSSSSPTPIPNPSFSSTKVKRKVTPLTPLPGQPDYANIKYYQLAALCRDRSLPGKGNEQEVRNRLIQDDTNVAEGRKREAIKNTNKKRKYKHVAPEDPGQGFKGERWAGSEGVVGVEGAESEGVRPTLTLKFRKIAEKGEE